MAYEPTIRAAATMTLALPKQGLLIPEVKPYVGKLYLADISVPPELYLAMGIKVSGLFAQEDIIHIA
jgi:NAD(P)H-hydrate epimerase